MKEEPQQQEPSEDESESPTTAWRGSSYNGKPSASASATASDTTPPPPSAPNKSGPLTEEEQRLVLSLHGKYGNKWRKIAAHVPGRSAKRLSKWFESSLPDTPPPQVPTMPITMQTMMQQHHHHHHHHPQQHHRKKQRRHSPSPRMTATADADAVIGRYDHILESIAEKYVQQRHITATQISHFASSSSISMPMPLPIFPSLSGLPAPPAPPMAPSLSLSIPPTTTPPPPEFSNLPSAAALPVAIPCLPPWLYKVPSGTTTATSNNTNTATATATASAGAAARANSSSSLSKSSPSSPSVTLSLSPSPAASSRSGAAAAEAPRERAEASAEAADDGGAAAGVGVVMEVVAACRELEERQQTWAAQKKEAAWRLKRLQQQLEAEKVRKRGEKSKEVEMKIKVLRDEELSYVERLEHEYREQLARIQRDAELKDGRMMELWSSKYLHISRLLDHLLHRH